MTANSYKININRLEKNLTDVLREIDQNGSNTINFEELGRILTIMQIFKVVQYNEECQLENQELFYSNNAKDQKRRYEEMIFHEQIWRCLNKGSNNDTVNIELVYSFFRITLDPIRVPPSDVALILKQYIDKYNGNEESVQKTQDMRQWAIEELVNNFRQFNKTKLAYTKIGYLKPKKFIEIKERENHSFKPKINVTSKKIDELHRMKFAQSNEALLYESENAKDTQNERVQMLYKKQEKYEQQIKEKKQQKLNEEMKECTFQPQKVNGKKKVEKVEKQELVDRLY